MSHKHQFFVWELLAPIKMINWKRRNWCFLLHADDMQLKHVPFNLFCLSFDAVAPAHSTLIAVNATPFKKCTRQKKNDKQTANWNWIKPRWLRIKFLLSFDWARTFSQNHTRSYLFCTYLFLCHSFVRLFFYLVGWLVALHFCLSFFSSFFFSWERENFNWQLNRFSLTVTKLIKRIDSIRKQKCNATNVGG